MPNRETSLITVHSQRLAGYLMLHGFVLIRLLMRGIWYNESVMRLYDYTLIMAT